MNMRFTQWTFALIMLVGCAGCTTVPSKQESPVTVIPAEKRQKTLAAFNDFTAKGKVGFIHHKTGGSASIDWQQKGTQYAIRLYGPLGSESVSIHGGPKQITLTRSNGRRVSATSPEMLILQELGYEIPVSGLQYWLKGIPAPLKLTHAPRLDAQGRLLRLEQNGWVINYIAYKNYGDLSVPHKIELEHFTQKHPHRAKLKFVFQQWLF